VQAVRAVVESGVLSQWTMCASATAILQWNAILSIAKRHGLTVISDSVQAPGVLYKEQYAGTLADIGGYSLNYHKHMHTGEGGILVTNDDALADRLRLIRNHAEAVVDTLAVNSMSNLVGYNFRLGEIECAIVFGSKGFPWTSDIC